ncbi:hypothetical protein KZZ52_54675 [Dactylosporangium sp. AC04546]|uniref:hypothetical protein n=1 Tax=Dactylosporangium sp. AC04546 TaxID=2862460 RepID=UPI001EDFE5E6|nr:hypothetical protein [Dactylosporangium sp. AC04546]WVK82885.1 hypothetical protein KZZ52_54675 [Dactylosporangium sp. AC04546]
MPVARPRSPLRRGVRRLGLAICALILGAGFTPAPPSTVESLPARIVLAHRSTVEPPVADPTVEEVQPRPVPVRYEQLIPGGRPVGAVAGRAPPGTSA